MKLEIKPTESFFATTQLRFVIRHGPLPPPGINSGPEAERGTVRILQQAWQGSHGTVRWLDVPTATEE